MQWILVYTDTTGQQDLLSLHSLNLLPEGEKKKCYIGNAPKRSWEQRVMGAAAQVHDRNS